MSDEPVSDALVWQGFSRTALDAAYNNMAAVPASTARLADWTARSAALRARMPAELDIPYGPRARNRIDIFRCGQARYGQVRAPLLVFIHGGWWQRNSRQVFSCMAEGPLAHGLDVALVGYTLAPEASLTDIVAEIIAALDCLAAREAANTCVLSGWSAGGHLTALALAHPFVAAGLSISGVFDLEPIRHSYINDKLRLDEPEARLLSPARLAPVAKPLVLAYGANELPELQRQSQDFAAIRAAGVGARLPDDDKAGHRVTTKPLPAFVRNTLEPLGGHDHFTILEELATPGGVLCRRASELALMPILA